MSEIPEHFKGKEAVEHVAEAQAQGLMAAAEIHGTEVPGHISAASDAARETAVVLMLIWNIFYPLNLTLHNLLLILGIFSIGWIIWKCGRSAWLGWSRLERLHRVLEQERWEIQHHRPQERSELKVLYAAKGLQGKLLEDVMDVLMADDSRLLRIMVEEELGLSLESHEHPLKQAVGALLGSLVTALICLSALFLHPIYGFLSIALVIVGISGYVLAKHSENRTIPAIVWNIGIAALSFGCSYFLMQFLIQNGFLRPFA